MPIIFFAVGIMLVLLEVFIPSFGLLTVGAIVCFVVSILKAYNPENPAAALIMGILAPALTLAILYFGLKYIPRTSWGRGLVLRHPSDDGKEGPPSTSEAAALTPDGGTEEDHYRPLLGKQGVAQSGLRPAGVAIIEGQRVDVVTEGALIDAGTRVKVVAVEGNRVVVRQARV